MELEEYLRELAEATPHAWLQKEILALLEDG